MRQNVFILKKGLFYFQEANFKNTQKKNLL